MPPWLAPSRQISFWSFNPLDWLSWVLWVKSCLRSTLTKTSKIHENLYLCRKSPKFTVKLTLFAFQVMGVNYVALPYMGSHRGWVKECTKNYVFSHRTWYFTNLLGYIINKTFLRKFGSKRAFKHFGTQNFKTR